MFVNSGYADENFYYNYQQRINLYPLSLNARNFNSIDYYKDDKGNTLGISNKLIVAFDKVENVDEILSEFNTTKIVKLYKTTYTITITDKKNTLKVANTLSKNNHVKYAHPDFVKKHFKR